jgi:hypothetical protein
MISGTGGVCPCGITVFHRFAETDYLHFFSLAGYGYDRDYNVSNPIIGVLLCSSASRQGQYVVGGSSDAPHFMPLNGTGRRAALNPGRDGFDPAGVDR